MYRPTTAPGHHLPHAWVTAGDQRRSTLDLVGRGRWALVVDTAAEQWQQALAASSSPLASLVDVVAVGPDAAVRSGEDWPRLREVAPGGALLVRPDTIVAWRARDLPQDQATALAAALERLVHGTVAAQP